MSGGCDHQGNSPQSGPMTVGAYVGKVVRSEAHPGCHLSIIEHGAKAKRAFIGVVGATATLTEVSLKAGYADQSHMTREFKKVFGRTPGEIRRRFRTYGRHEDSARL